MIQPRRAGPGRGDGHSPDPAFTPAQYDRLALLYTIVSVRAGRWLVPAFHAALDADIPNGHDDPLNFKVDSFADSIDRLIEKLHGAEQYQASNATTATDAQSDAPPPTGDGFWIDALWGTPRKMTAPPPIAAADNAPKPNADTPADTDSAAVKLPEAAGGAANSDPMPNSAAAPAPAAAVKSPLPAAKPGVEIAAHESEAPHKQKSADAKDCTPHRARGRRHQSCEPDRAGDRDHGRHAERSADRSGPARSDSPRHHNDEARARHAQGSSRHHRS
jgi:hypothetical protein